MRRFPDTILFSKVDPAGISILSPWLAMMITVPCVSYVCVCGGGGGGGGGGRTNKHLIKKLEQPSYYITTISNKFNL